MKKVIRASKITPEYKEITYSGTKHKHLSVIGSAPEANRRQGLVKFGAKENVIICKDDSGTVSIHPTTGKCMLDTSTGDVITSLNFDLEISGGSDASSEYWSGITGMSLTPEEFKEFFNKIHGKSYDEILNILESSANS